jgi:hypothetical protein
METIMTVAKMIAIVTLIMTIKTTVLKLMTIAIIVI